MTLDEARDDLAMYGPGGDLIEFAGALREADVLLGTPRIMHFFEKPWQYADEYMAWHNHGSPQDDSDAGWDAFLAELDGGPVALASQPKTGTGR